MSSTLNDQGVCSWNYPNRSPHQCTKNDLKSYYQAKEVSATSSSAVSDKKKRSKEESMRKIMDLSCWGPSTTKF
ncbi:hypothetical protein ACB092_06G078200 [Castanea dentata]